MHVLASLSFFMSDIRQYKPQLIIELMDGDKIPTDKTMDEFEAFLATNPPYIRIGDVMFAKHQYKKSYIKNIRDVDIYISQLAEKEKAIVEKRTQSMKTLWKKREDIQQIDRFLLAYKQEQDVKVYH